MMNLHIEKNPILNTFDVRTSTDEVVAAVVDEDHAKFIVQRGTSFCERKAVATVVHGISVSGYVSVDYQLLHGVRNRCLVQPRLKAQILLSQSIAAPDVMENHL